MAEVEFPSTTKVESELRRLARERLGGVTERDAGSRSNQSSRSLRHQRQPIVGAFDSPDGFAFSSHGANRKG